MSSLDLNASLSEKVSPLSETSVPALKCPACKSASTSFSELLG